VDGIDVSTSDAPSTLSTPSASIPSIPHTGPNRRPELVVDNELDEDVDAFICLFCPHTSTDLPSLWRHTTAQHDFDFLALCSSHQLDFYGRIRLVNFVRSAVKDGFGAADVLEGVRGGQWREEDKFLQPVMEDDAVLFNLEDDEEDAEWDNEDADEDEEDEDEDDDEDEKAETTVR
jgi:hypothetical protein